LDREVFGMTAASDFQPTGGFNITDGGRSKGVTFFHSGVDFLRSKPLRLRQNLKTPLRLPTKPSNPTKLGFEDFVGFVDYRKGVSKEVL
jgi:hypothetical protein